VFEVRGLTSGYRGKTIVSDVDLSVEPGRIAVVIGPNGAGKSTLLKTLMGFVRLQRGTIEFEQRRIERLAPQARIRAGMAYVAQSGAAFPSLSVEENLRAGGYQIRSKHLVTQRMDDVYERFPALRGLRKTQAAKLSGGERRMLEIGRFLMQEPRLVMLDEPSIGLSPGVAELVYQQVRTLADGGTSFLIVEQNVRLALTVADYVYVLELGRNRFEGEPDALKGDTHLRSLFLGSSSEADVQPATGIAQ
jgi:branched-chain amino acid transport system ATP-binding protein